ncbi:MAG TPA: hypothetical protein VFZ49_03260 [Pyrinomonadaceae bacterium]
MSCSVSGEHIGWLEASLNDWHRVKRQALKLRDSPRPLMILFDEKCSVSLEPGKSLRAMRAEPHKGIVALPGSRSVPAQLITFAATYEVHGGKLPFFVFSLPSVWKAAPHLANEPNVDTLIGSVFIHEMTHTLHGSFHSWLDEHEKLLASDEQLDDDIIQKRFEKNDAFRDSVKSETDFLYLAAIAPSKADSRSQARRALTMIEKRRKTSLAGRQNAVYAELEDVFLTMEGVANWAAYKAALNKGFDRQKALDLIRRGGKYWSQDQGLAIFLVIDRLLPGWQKRAFAPKAATALELLADAVE